MRAQITYWMSHTKIRYAVFGVLGIVLLCLAFVAFTLLRQKEGPSVAGKDEGVTLVDYAGSQVQFDSFLGVLGAKPLVVFFWASWCPYCTEEFVRLSEVKQQYGDRVQVVAINRGESAQDAKQFSERLPQTNGIVFLIDPDDLLFKKLGGYAVPETIFINAHGEEVVHAHGPISGEDIAAAMKQLIK